MMNVNLKFLLNWWRFSAKRRQTKGFTLTELLVSIMIGGVIISGLLSLVVDLVQTDREESARTETQREMQMALNFIASEAREAVYIYDGNCLQGAGTPTCSDTGLFKTGSPYVPDGDREVPILAFWKLDPLPTRVKKDKCGGSPDPGTPCLAAHTYSLVVYSLKRRDQNSSNEPWKGKARIIRHELAKYRSDGTPTPGYVDPIDPTNGTARFRLWPRPAGSIPKDAWYSAVLVDFVDDQYREDKRDSDEDGSPDKKAKCPDQYILTPSDETLSQHGFGSTSEPVRSFYACVRDAANDSSSTASSTGTTLLNQKLALFIRGNASGRPGSSNKETADLLPAIETQVLNRSVYNKDPAGL